MSRGRFTASAEDWGFGESGGAEEFLTYVGELTPEEQRRRLAADGIREALIDCGQEQALRRIERGWSEGPRKSSRMGQAAPAPAL